MYSIEIIQSNGFILIKHFMNFEKKDDSFLISRIIPMMNLCTIFLLVYQTFAMRSFLFSLVQSLLRSKGIHMENEIH